MRWSWLVVLAVMGQRAWAEDVTVSGSTNCSAAGIQIALNEVIFAGGGTVTLDCTGEIAVSLVIEGAGMAVPFVTLEGPGDGSLRLVNDTGASVLAVTDTTTTEPVDLTIRGIEFGCQLISGAVPEYPVISVTGSSLHLDNVLISDCEAGTEKGTGVQVSEGSTLTANNSRFEGLTQSGSGLGGAIYVGQTSTATLNDCVIANSAADQGGAIHVRKGGTLTLSRSLVLLDGDAPAARDDGLLYVSADGGSTGGVITITNTVLLVEDGADAPDVLLQLVSGDLTLSNVLLQGAGTGLSVTGDATYTLLNNAFLGFSDGALLVGGASRELPDFNASFSVADADLQILVDDPLYETCLYGREVCLSDYAVWPTADSPFVDGGDPDIDDPTPGSLAADLGAFGGPGALWPDIDGEGDGGDDDQDGFPSFYDECEDGEDDVGVTEPLPYHQDLDGDGYGAATVYGSACPSQWPADVTQEASDCDDADGARYPDAEETCDGKDNDCDEAIDEEPTIWYQDADGDRYGDTEITVEDCLDQDGYVSEDEWLGADCDDQNADINPGTLDTDDVDGIDQNCDGAEGEDAKAGLSCGSSCSTAPPSSNSLFAALLAIVLARRRSRRRAPM